MAIRRRRKAGTWLPILGQPSGETTVDGSTAGFYSFATIPLDGTPTIGMHPLTFDTPQEGNTLSSASDTLAEIIGSEYICKRIVGNVLFHNDTQVSLALALETPPAILVTAGLFVARAGSEQEAAGPDAPVGWSNTDLTVDLQNYGPDHPAAIREPWMWRRTWILGCTRRLDLLRASTGLLSYGASVYPDSTAWYGGGMRDAGQIDVKSRRRVGQDDRLFFIYTARNYPTSTPNVTVPALLDCFLSIRIFGQIVKARNRGSF